MSAVVKQIPPLAPGDNLTRAQFLRRWEAHPEITKAELIGGIVYMPSPVTAEHGDMEGDVGIWLGTYKINTPGCAMGHNTTSFMLDDSPQPDINLRILPAYGGSSRLEGNFLDGAPELLAEICRSSAAYDLHQKLDLYQEAGVQEYLAVLLHENEVRWHFLEEGFYQLLHAGPDHVWRSRVFPGLWLNGPALLSGNMSEVMATLQEGLKSREHEAFVKELASRRKKKAPKK